MKKHLITSKYLKEHSLVESNIVSFNNFIENRMQEIVDDLNNSLNNEEIETKLGRVRVEKPNVIEADGSVSIITPTEARLRSLTYSAPVFLEITIKQGQQTESHDVEIGRIPSAQLSCAAWLSQAWCTTRHPAAAAIATVASILPESTTKMSASSPLALASRCGRLISSSRVSTTRDKNRPDV